MRFLIDECLTTALVSVANLRGYEARHVVLIGKAGWSDLNVTRYAIDGDFVVVTNNASDFRRLYAAQPLHAGLVILLPVVSREVQKMIFDKAIETLALVGEPVNQVVEVGLAGGEVTFRFLDLFGG